jgi:hypothetical protein
LFVSDETNVPYDEVDESRSSPSLYEPANGELDQSWASSSCYHSADEELNDYISTTKSESTSSEAFDDHTLVKNYNRSSLEFNIHDSNLLEGSMYCTCSSIDGSTATSESTSLEAFDDHTLVKNYNRSFHESNVHDSNLLEDSIYSSRSSSIDGSLQMEKEVLPSPPDKIQNMPSEQMMHWANLGSCYRRWYENSRYCDVRFLVENKVLLAHRAVLCSASPYFASLFNNSGYPYSNPLEDVPIQGVSMKSFRALMDFIYTGHLEIATPIILDLIKLSHHFDIPEIKRRCVRQTTHLSDDDLIYLLADSRKRMEDSFADTILKLISQRFPSVSRCESFLDLDANTLCVILSHDGLNTTTEMDVFQAATRWIYNEPNQRLQYLETVMECVRFPLMTRQELFKCVIKNPLLKANDTCLLMILEANW